MRTNSHISMGNNGRLKFYNVEFTIQMETHCLAQPFSCLAYEKAGEPSTTPPPSKAPFSFLPLFHPFCIAVGHPRANITLHQLGYFHFAHSEVPCISVQSEESKAYFLSVFMFDSSIFTKEFQNRGFVYKNKKYITIIFIYFIIK